MPYEYWLTTGFDAVGGDLIDFDDIDTLDECIEKCNMHFDCSVKDSKQFIKVSLSFKRHLLFINPHAVGILNFK